MLRMHLNIVPDVEFVVKLFVGKLGEFGMIYQDNLNVKIW
jgi:hypothetical protein